MSSEPPALAQEEAPEASSSPPKESARGGGAAAGGLETNTLWVGNLHQQASEADVMAAFAPHSALDCVVARAGAGARGYAFVLFHRTAEARAALEALQGSKIKGAAIRNEFARPARAVRNLWVGGIDPSIPKGELEEEFQKFGKIEGVAFSHDQTAAYIDFEKLEDAISAHRALNGTVLGGKELCVDFQRSRGRTEWSEVSNLNGKVSMPPGEMRVGSAKGSTGLRMREAQPTNVLWVGFPGLYKINEEMLRRAMAAHGMVTNIKVFPARQYAFVEFATIKEASNAKNLLDGRLFNDSRIQILFSNSELAPNKLDNPTQVVGFPRSEMYYNDGHLDYSGPGLGSHGTLQGYDPRRGRSRHGDYGGGSVTGGILPSPEPGTFLAGRSAHDTSDPREAKRMRLDAGADPYDVRTGSEGLYPVGYSHGGVAARAERSSSPAIRIQGTVHRTSFLEHFWRGSIAKGGSPVCRARCLPIRKGTEIPLPDIVNCSARTGLDMLAKHYGDASGFDIVFFLPDSEDDFVSYTEFLRYLGSKGRAGVVKVDAGTTLFLVPPSDFLTNVLQVDGPERLYGVVLHIPQMATSAVQRPQLTGPEPQPYYNEKETVFTSQRNYSIDNQLQDADYRGSLHEESLHRLGQVPVRARGVDEGQAVQPILATLPANQTAGPQAHTSLRPDIMSTIAKLMPSNSMQSSALGTGQVPLGSTDRPVASLMHDASTLSKVWKPENQAMASTSSFEHMGNLQQPGQQFSKQVPLAHLTNYGNMLNAQEHSAHTAYNPEITLNLPPAPAPPPLTLPPTSAILSSMSGHSLTTHMSQQQYQPEQYYMSQSSYGPLATASHSNQHVSNANLPVPPPLQVNSASLPANNQMGNLSQLQLASALPTDRVIPDFSSQVQQQQNVASGAAQAPDEADKNKKYQATLQFAHNLLLQLQRGSGNQP